MGNAFFNAPVGSDDSNLKLWHLFAGAGILLVLNKFTKIIVYRYRNILNRAAAKKMITERNEKKYEFKLVTGDELKTMDVFQIRKALMDGKYTSVDLVNYFGNRCQTLGRELSLTTDELFESAMKLAVKCDDERQEAMSKGEQDKLPYLHGIPISIKDLFDMKGTLSTVGCAMLNMRSEVDSPAITPILESGAIPLCKGNVPQAALSIHTTNYIWGTAKNVYDRERSTGGSSGGDAGLVAARCVPIAMGSDIGGSIRIPSHFTGLCGFKPTQNRITYIGGNSARITKFDQGFGHFQAVGGPLAHSVRDCIEFFKIQCVDDAHLKGDPFRAPVPFRQDIFDGMNQDKSRIKVGILKETPFLPVSKSTSRALEIAEKALVAEGYQVVKFDITPEEYALARDSLVAMVINGTAWDLGQDFEQQGERLILGVYTNMLLMKAGPMFRGFIKLLLKAIGMGRLVTATKNVRKMPSHEYDNVMKTRYEFAYKFSQKWQKAGVSAIVTPVFPHCSFRDKHADDMGMMLEYIFMWAILYYPAGVMPVTTVLKEEESFTDCYNDGWTKLINETAKNSAGMPIGVQVIAHTYEDEKALAVMQSLENQIKFKMPSPDV